MMQRTRMSPTAVPRRRLCVECGSFVFTPSSAETSSGIGLKDQKTVEDSARLRPVLASCESYYKLARSGCPRSRTAPGNDVTAEVEPSTYVSDLSGTLWIRLGPARPD